MSPMETKDVMTITKAMSTVVMDMDEDIQKQFFKEDIKSYIAYHFERIAEVYKDAELSDEEKKTKIDGIWLTVHRILQECGISFSEKGGTAAKYLLEQVDRSDLPSKRSIADVEDHLTKIMLRQFMRFPDPTRFMERLVDKLSPGTMGTGDTLRLRILKRFIEYGNYLQDAGYGSRVYINNYVKEKTKKKKLSMEQVLANLDDGIFDKANEELQALGADVEEKCKALMAESQPLRAKRDELARERSKNIENRNAFQEQLKKALAAQPVADNNLKQLNIQQRNIQGLLNTARVNVNNAQIELNAVIVRELNAGADPNQNNFNVNFSRAQLNREQKKEAKHANDLEKVQADIATTVKTISEVQEEIKRLPKDLAETQDKIAALDNEIAAVRSEIAPYDRRIDNQKNRLKELRNGRLRLLMLANDLATGQFRTGGATKEGLYLFAIVYGMHYGTVYADRSDIDLKYMDVEKNLFRDYYCNNLIRYFSGEAYRENPTAFEDAPNEQGVNCKNFLEVLFLYYLNLEDETVSAAERLKRIYAMRKRLLARAPRTAAKVHTVTESTQIFRNQILEVLHKTEDELEEYIASHYTIDTFARAKGGKVLGNRIAAMQVSIDQNSAFEQYKKLCADRMEVREDGTSSLRADAEGLAFVQKKQFENRLFSQVLPAMDGMVSEENARDFLILTQNFNRFVMRMANSVETPQMMSRTALLAAFHAYFNEECDEKNEAFRAFCDENGKLEGKNPLSFRVFYSLYEKMANEYLENAYYQPLNTKIVFDVMLVFSSYYNIYFK